MKEGDTLSLQLEVAVRLSRDVKCSDLPMSLDLPIANGTHF